MKTLLAFLGVVLVVASSPALHASEPTGFYVLVEDVQLVQTAKELDGIKIRGVFMGEIDMVNDRVNLTSPARVPPKRGWVYFSLPQDPTKHRLAQLEWADLASIAKANTSLPTDQKKCVAFGSSHSLRLVEWPGVIGLVRDKEPTVSAMAYPVDHGMYLLRQGSDPDRQLKEEAKKSTPQ